MTRDIAIIGMAGRFPGATNLDQLRRNLEQGRDSVKDISPGRKKNTNLPADGEYMVCGYLEDIDKFDYKLFDISLGEAQTMGPLQRLLLEIVYETFENAGYNIDDFRGSNTSVYIAHADSDYYRHADEFSPTLITGNSSEFLAAQIARQFDLRGNAVVTNTACSSALTALHQACNEILMQDTDLALVGAANLFLFPFKGGPDQLDMYSPDGKSKAFSAAANGMSHGEMAACILVKPLEEAIADQDIIHAVIKGSAVNNNGHRSLSPTAPDSIMQTQVITRAWKRAGVHPKNIGFIEAHGSGTQLGDSLEIEGLNLAFREFTPKKKICPISTIKSNVGHTMTAAGMAGLIKSILSLKHQILFPCVHFDTPNPLIDFENSAVYVNKHLKKWEARNGLPRCAAVTSLGVSGTNVHVVLEEVPPAKESKGETQDKREGVEYLVTLSSRRPEGLMENIHRLYRHIDNNPTIQLCDIAFTLTRGRVHHPIRFATIAQDTEELKEQLKQVVSSPSPNVEQVIVHNELKKNIFILSDHPSIPGSLVEHFQTVFPVFHEHFNRCTSICQPSNKNSPQVRDFAFQYAFYQLASGCNISSNRFLAIGIGAILKRAITREISLEEAVAEATLYQSRPIENLESRVKALISRETAAEPTAFIDMGPKGPLSAKLAEKCTPGSGFYVFFLDECCKSPFLDLIKSLYLARFNIDWHAMTFLEGRKVELPGYSFAKTRCWLKEESKVSDPKTSRAEDALPEIMETFNDMEKITAALWKEILEIQPNSVDDDFFELGGDSLDTTRVISQLNSKLGIQLSFEDMFDFPTIRTLSRYIEDMMGTERKLALIWKDVLKVAQVKPGDNFFDLGGHSLMANQVLLKIKKTFHLELNFEDFFQNPTLETLVAYIDNRLKEGFGMEKCPDIEPAGEQDFYPLSAAQERLYVLQQMDQKSLSYNEFHGIFLEGVFEADRLERALEKISQRHDSFRTSFHSRGNIAVQKIHNYVDIDVEYHDISHLDISLTSEPDSLPTDFTGLIKNFVRPFDLSLAPLLRVTIAKIAENKHLLLIDMHHIITDGTSLQVFIQEIMNLYNNNPLPQLKYQYKDYALWEQSPRAQAIFKKQEDYWCKRFAQKAPGLSITTDFPRQSANLLVGDHTVFYIDGAMTAKITNMASGTGTTLFMILLAAFSILLAKYSGQEDVVVGTPTSGRRHSDLHNTIGMFANTVPIRTAPQWKKSFRQYLAEVKHTALQAFENQDYPFDRLVKTLNLEREPGRNPLLDAVLAFNNYRVDFLTIPGLNISEFELRPFLSNKYMAKFELLLEVFQLEKAQGLKIDFLYFSGLYKRETIQRMGRHWCNIIDHVLREPDVTLGDIEMISEDEKKGILKGIRGTKTKTRDNAVKRDVEFNF